MRTTSQLVVEKFDRSSVDSCFQHDTNTHQSEHRWVLDEPLTALGHPTHVRVVCASQAPNGYLLIAICIPSGPIHHLNSQYSSSDPTFERRDRHESLIRQLTDNI